LALLLSRSDGVTGFPNQFRFEDYSTDELEEVLRREVKKARMEGPPFVFEDCKMHGVCARRLSMSSGSRGFANARAVRSMFEQLRDRQA